MTIQHSYGISLRKNDAFAYNWYYVRLSYGIRTAPITELDKTLKYIRR